MTIKPEILYIAHRIPYPPNKGDKIRSFNEIRYLSKQFVIDLVCLADDPGDMAHAAVLKKYCRRVAVFSLNPVIGKLKGLFSLVTGRSISEGYFYHLGMAVTIKRWLKRHPYRAVLCFSSPMARYLESMRAFPGTRPGLIMDFCDLDSDKWRQYADSSVFPLNWIYKIEARRLLTFEKKINRWFDACVFVSEKEGVLFKTWFPGACNVVSIPNGVDVDYFNPDICKKFKDFESQQSHRGFTLMFAGVMDYHANVDGVLWFCDAVLPRIREKIPGIRLIIAGSNPCAAIQSLAKEKDIIVTGFVPDMRPWYCRAHVCVVPLRIARGVQNKVLEAMAMEKPVVATGAALQGLSVVPGRDVIMADDAGTFARAVVDLLNHPDRAAGLARQAGHFVSSAHGWSFHMERFSSLIAGD